MPRAGSRLNRLLVIATCALCACGEPPTLPSPRAAAGKPGPRRGGTLRISLADDVRTLDPAIAFDEFSLLAECLVFEGLIAYKPTSSGKPLELQPALAESWTVSEDRRVYTFTLRPAVYEDGTPIVADDFVTTFERIYDPGINSPAKQFYLGLAGAEARMNGQAERVSGVRALDARRLELTLLQPDESFLMVLAMAFVKPMPRAWIDRQGERIRDRPLASGPFRLAEWRQGNLMIFERNPRYWNPELPYLDRIEMNLQVQRDVAMLKLLRGELDTIDRLSSDKYVLFARSPEWKDLVRINRALNVYGERMDVTQPPFDDKRVRQAMNYALDKQDSYLLYNHRLVISHGALPPDMPGYDPTMKPYPHDPEKARRLLAEAGYPDGFDVDYYCTNDEIAVKLAQSIQSDLAEVGVRMRIRPISFPTYLSAVGRKQLPFSYTAWFMDFPDPWNFLEIKFHSKNIAPVNSNNDSYYSNPEVDRLLDAARVEPDRDKRLALYHQVELILYDDCPWIWHYHGTVTEVVQPYVKNYHHHPVYLRDYRETWLDR